LPTIVLARALTYQFQGRIFRRGEPQEIDESAYLFLLSQGFIDPGHEIQVVHPSKLSKAPPGTEVPVIRTGGLGDVLMVLPGLRELARRYPRLRFTYATSAAFVPLLRDCLQAAGGFLYRAIALSELHGRQQWAIDLRGYSERENRERDDRPAVFARYLLSGGMPGDWTYPIKARPDELAYGRALTGALDHHQPVLGIVDGSHSQDGMRNWPTEYVERLADLAFERGVRSVILDDRVRPVTARLAAAGVRSLAGHLTVPMFMAVLGSLDFLATPDTGALHLAEALGVRTVGYFTTIPPAARAAHYRYVRTLYAGVPCAPCYHAPTCGLPPGGTKCAQAVTPARVWQEIEWMARTRPPYDYRASLEGPQPQPVTFQYAEAH
jgi:ADP-heptose:LPS heptosyltransferase